MSETLQVLIKQHAAIAKSHSPCCIRQ